MTWIVWNRSPVSSEVFWMTGHHCVRAPVKVSLKEMFRLKRQQEGIWNDSLGAMCVFVCVISDRGRKNADCTVSGWRNTLFLHLLTHNATHCRKYRVCVCVIHAVLWKQPYILRAFLLAESSSGVSECGYNCTTTPGVFNLMNRHEGTRQRCQSGGGVLNMLMMCVMAALPLETFNLSVSKCVCARLVCVHWWTDEMSRVYFWVLCWDGSQHHQDPDQERVEVIERMDS